MTIKEKIQENIKEALKERRSETVSALRMVMAAIANFEIEKRGKGEAETIADEEIIAVLRREVKKRREAAELFRTGGREEAANKEAAEADIIQAYLPSGLERQELEKIISEEIDKVGKEIGVLMKAVMERVAGRADGKVVSEIVKSKI